VQIIDGHPPGNFCWYELGTSDQDAAIKFYSGLFPWTVTKFPMGPDSFYAIPKIQDRDVCGIYKLGPEMQGVPPHWMPYVSVASADDTAAKVKAAGGAALMEPFDVFDMGRMFAMRDPTGAHLSVWQSKTHKGVGIGGAHGTPCWAELATRDTKASATFYTAVFGWGTKESSKPPMPPYVEWQNGGMSIGGMVQMDAQWGDVPPHWGMYFMVDDCDALAEKVKSGGGQILHGPFDLPGVGRMAVAKDPQGAVFNFIKLTQPM